MKITKKELFSLLLVLFAVCCFSFIISQDKNITRADALENATYGGIYSDASYNSSQSLLLTYTSDTAWDDTDNGNLASKVYVDGQLIPSNCIAHWGGQKWINFSPKNVKEGSIFEIKEGATFANKNIPAISLYFNGTSWGEIVEYSSIVHNNINYATIHPVSINTGDTGIPTDGIYVNIGFSFSFGNADTKNYATKDYAIGSGLKINGIPIKDIAGSCVDFVYGSNMICVYVPFTSIPEYKRITLTVDNLTEFKGKYINSFSLYYDSTTWTITPNVKNQVNYAEITWNNTNYAESYNDKKGVLLAFDKELSLNNGEYWGLIKDVDLKSYYGKYVKINGQTVNSIADAELRYYYQNFLWIYSPSMTTANGQIPTIEIVNNTPFLDAILPSLKLYFNSETNLWQTTKPIKSVTFSEIAWNNTSYGDNFGGKAGVLLAFSDNLSLNFDEINGSLQNTNQKDVFGANIKINGQALNTITDAELKYHSQNFLWIYAPNMTSASGQLPTIEITQDTLFLDVSLPSLEIYFNSANSQWQTTKPKKAVTFSNFIWNNISYGDNYGGKAGVLLNFSDNLSYDSSAVNGSLQNTNQVDIYGSGILLNGVTLNNVLGSELKYYSNGYLWIYAPTMTLANGPIPTIEILANTPFLDANLPSLTLYWNGVDAWQTTNPIRAVNYYGISWNNINWLPSVFGGGNKGLLLEYDANLSLNTNENNSQLVSVELKDIYGSKIKINGQTLNTISGAELRYYYVGFLWIYAPDMTTASGQLPMIEIEDNTPFCYSILPSLTLYFLNGLWTTTVTIPELGTPDCDFTGFVYAGDMFWNNAYGQVTYYIFPNFNHIENTKVSYLSTTGYHIKLDGTPLVGVSGVDIYTYENQPWLCIDIPNAVEGSILSITEGTPFSGNFLPELYFKFINGHWVKTFTINFEVGTENFTLYQPDDVPFSLNDESFEEILLSHSIYDNVINFTIRDVTYKAGTTFNVLTNTNIQVNTIGFNTSSGASVRLSDPTGIRFETRVNKADYDYLFDTFGASNIETGTYILPRQFLITNDFRSFFNNPSKVNGVDYVKLVNNGFVNRATAETDGYYKYYGSLVNIKPNNYCTDFFGIGYIKINAGSETYTVYGGYNVDEHTRTIYYVSSRSYSDFGVGTLEQNIIKGYLDGVVYLDELLQLSSIVDVDGYTSPYSINYNNQTGVYTVTGDSEIKSVMIDGVKKLNSRTNKVEINGHDYYIIDYSLNSSASSSTITFKLSSIPNPLTMVDFNIEVPSNNGIKILQLTDTELIDALQARSSDSLTSSQKTEYARKNVYANCFNYINQLIEQGKPDLIVLTGDIVNGNFDDNGTMLLKMIEYMDSLNIPWAPVFGSLDNQSAKGATWQREQFKSANNCLFKDGTVTGNGDYTIGITDNGVLRRVIYMLNSNADGITSSQVDWMKNVSLTIASNYTNIPAFVFYNTNSTTDFTSEFALANIDGVFMGNNPYNNSSDNINGIIYTYGTKTGSYGSHDVNKLGGTFIDLSSNCKDFTINNVTLNKTEIQNKLSIDLVEKYDDSSLVDDAYFAPIWNTNRIYDETGLFVGETGSVTLMYTPTDPLEVTVRDITLGVTYTYGIDYTISGNKVTRVSGGNLPYIPYDEFYRSTPVTYNGISQTFAVTPDKNKKAEDGYTINGTKYLFYCEAHEGARYHVTFTYNKTQAWTGTQFTGDVKAQSFINKLKTERKAKIMFYGDSITVGCNASGTEFGGNRKPFLPAWNDLVTNYLEKLYGAEITKYNGAVGGWTTAQGVSNLSSKLTELNTNLSEIDLFVIAFGMNDPQTAQNSYITSIMSLIDTYYTANPNGSILLVSPMKPNTQSTNVLGNQIIWEETLNAIKNNSKYTNKNLSLARVYTLFNELNTVCGKLSRDYLGNNINHPNDFGVRIYAQVILKTLCGDDFN